MTRLMNRSRTIAAMLTVAALAACSREGMLTLPSDVPASEVKFYNFALNAPNVNFYANDTKMTAINSTSGAESTIGTGYGGVAAGGFYTAAAAGQYTLSGRISAATDNGVTIGSVPATLAAGSAYSFYLSGPYNTTTKTSDAFLVTDALPAMDYTLAYVRFVNAIFNANP